MEDDEEPQERLRPMPCWLAERGEAISSVVMVQDGMTAWSGYDGTLAQTVEAWLRNAVEQVRDRSSLGDDEDGWVTARPPLPVLIDVEERWEMVKVSHDLIDRLAYFLRVDLGEPVPAALDDLVAYVITWAARLPRVTEKVVEDPVMARLPRWKAVVVQGVVPAEELKAWARGWRSRRRVG